MRRRADKLKWFRDYLASIEASIVQQADRQARGEAHAAVTAAPPSKRLLQPEGRRASDPRSHSGGKKRRGGRTVGQARLWQTRPSLPRRDRAREHPGEKAVARAGQVWCSCIVMLGLTCPAAAALPSSRLWASHARPTTSNVRRGRRRAPRHRGGADLCSPTMEEIGYRTAVFSLEGVTGSQREYIEWMLMTLPTWISGSARASRDRPARYPAGRRSAFCDRGGAVQAHPSP